MKIQEARDWINSLHAGVNHKTELYHYTGYSELPDGYVSLMWMERDGKIFVNEDGKDVDGLFFEMPHAYYGDYIGDTVTWSNFNVLTSEKLLEDNDFPPHIVGISGFDGHSLYYNLAKATEEQLDNLKEMVEALDGYPVVDEDAWANLEQEIIDKDVYEYLKENVEYALSRMGRDDIYLLYDEDENNELLGDALFSIIQDKDIEVYVEGCYNVVYSGWDDDKFAEEIVRMFDSNKEG